MTTMEPQAVMQALRKNFGPEFHTTYGGGVLAMTRVISDRFRLEQAEAEGWLQALIRDGALRWESDEGLASPPDDDDGYWELG